jgi:hypothetical protein
LRTDHQDSLRSQGGRFEAQTLLAVAVGANHEIVTLHPAQTIKRCENSQIFKKQDRKFEAHYL